jgi:uncharacterized protein (DUF302 family)
MLKTSMVAAGLLLAGVTSGLAADTASVVTYQKKGVFADVRQDVADGIVAQGFVVDYTARIGDMLARTAKDVGAAKTVYASAETLQFCPAKLSRDLFEANPADIAFCPHVIAVYELDSKPGVIHVAYRKMPGAMTAASRKARAAMTGVLDGIARKATR